MRALYAVENGYTLTRRSGTRSRGYPRSRRVNGGKCGLRYYRGAQYGGGSSIDGGLGKELKFGATGAALGALATHGNPWGIAIGASTGLLATRAFPKEFH